MQINVVFDQSVASAPVGFVSAINYVVGLFDSLFTSPITVTIDVGYGEVNGAALSTNALGQSHSNYATFSYSQVHDALITGAQSSTQIQAASTLPASNPDGAANYTITQAEADALGLGSFTGVVGEVGFSSSFAFDYAPGTTPVPGQFDFVGVAEHEFSEILGRQSGIGFGFGSVMDLFRFSASGVRQFATGTGYFSIDGGATDLGDWNTGTSGGDLGDWAASVGHDAFLAFSSPGLQNYLTTADVELMNVLGLGIANAPNTVPAGVTELNQTLASGAKEIVLSGGQSIGVVIQGGAQQTINVGGTATGTTIGGLESDLGSVSGETVVSGGTLLVGGGGLDNGSAIDAGGFETIAAGGSATGEVVSGTQTVLGSATSDTLAAGGTVVNGSSTVATAVIGGAVGVTAPGAGTVTNFGTISGSSGTAVQFGSAGDRLIVEPGAQFVGVASGGGGTLEFVGGGTFAGLGATFVGFATYQLDAGTWSLPGGALTLAPGKTLANLGTVGGTLTLSAASDRLIAGKGSKITGSVTGGGGTLELAGGVGTITGLSGAGKLSGADVMTFSGFGAYAIDSGASWSLAGGSGTLGTNQTLANSGTLTGALSLATVNDRVVVGAGAKFTGAVKGGGGTLELAGGVGTLTGVGVTGTLSGSAAMTFSGFGTYDIDSGSTWTMSGATALASGQHFSVGGNLTNLGSIVSATTDGLDLTAGASVVNGSSTVSSALIQGVYGVYGGQGPITVNNFGTIKGTGKFSVAFAYAADTLIAEAGSSTVGEIAGGGGVLDLRGVSGTIGGLGAGGYVTGATPMNFYGFGTYLLEAGETWTLVGSATLGAGQTLANSATLHESVPVTVNGVLDNQGIINAGTLVSVLAGENGQVVNGASGNSSALIYGFLGVYTSGASYVTVTNFGTIEGTGYAGAVLFNTASDRLIAESGSAVIGAVGGGGGVLELASGVGTISHLGGGAGGTITGDIAMTFSSFGAYVLDSGDWTLLAADSVSGQGLIDGATLINDGAFTAGQDPASPNGAGSFGVELLPNASLTNYGGFTGGAGATGGGGGGVAGAGGEGVLSAAAIDIKDYGTIAGGHGGNGVNGAGRAGSGGAGGVGVSVLYGGSLYLGGALNGGAGGAGGSASMGGAGGAGGAALVLSDPSAFIESALGALATGGAGGAAGPSSGSAGLAGGAGGAGAIFTGGLEVTETGLVSGGQGGAGGGAGAGTSTHVNGYNGGAGGAGGAGIELLTDGSLLNFGAIVGGAGGAGGLGGAAFGGGAAGATGAAGMSGDGIDIDVTGRGRIYNGVYGHYTARIQGRVGVYAGPSGQATVTNDGTIIGTSGVAVQFANAADKLIVSAHSHFTGSAVGGGGTLNVYGITGSITGLGGSATMTGGVSLGFSGFGDYYLHNANIDMTGFNTLVAGRTLSNDHALFVGGTLVDTGLITNGYFGEIDVTNGATLQTQGLIENAGDLQLTSGAANTDLRVLAAGATLAGAGFVVMSGSKARILGATATATLTNVDNTISGTGFIGANSLTLINQSKGVIDAVGAAGLTVGTKGSTLTNQGLMEATGGGILIIANTTVANLGGTILATNGSPVDLQDDVVRGGGITASGTGVVKVNVAGGELDGTTNAVSLSGVAFIVNGSNETLEGSIANSGKINLIASTSTSDLIIGAAGAILSGGGQVNMTNSLKNRIYGLASGDTLTNVDNRIDGAGVLGNGTMTLINDAKGQIVGNQNLALTIDTGTNTITNAGLIENVGKGGTLVKSAVANTGTLLAATAGTLTLAGAVTGAGVGQINGGTLYVQQAFAEKVTFTGSTGTLELGDSQAFTGKVVGLSTSGTNALDLVDIGFFAAKTKATYSGTTASGTLTVTDGTHTAHITLQGNYTGASWTLSGDGHGGTKVIDPSGPLSQAMAGFGATIASTPVGMWTHNGAEPPTAISPGGRGTSLA